MYGNQFVARKKADSDLPAFSDAVELRNRRFLDKTELGSHHDIAFGAGFVYFRFGIFFRYDVLVGFDFRLVGNSLFSRNYRRYSFAVVHLNEVDYRSAPCRFLRFGYFVAFKTVYFTERREEQQIVVRGAYEHILDEIFVFGFVRCNALATATLSLTFFNAQPLDVAEMRHRNDDVFSFDKICFADIRVIGRNFGFSRRGIPVFYIEQVVFDNGNHSFGLLKNVF